ncbi:Hypothetical predicted protein [Mytilus galloprovincialis]|uniref:Uncharacterized protein n=1 Tax=Mytilus galloprovincialis TaxID=29158 RepID=A0A8B6CDU0_MYTGA|nr:Hypothetical predicted protein [Mytilus galloprovincialis]
MVVATGACVVAITTGGAAVPVISAAATSGSGFGVAGAVVGTAKAIGGAVGVAASSGAIAGATATGTAAGAGIGAAIGGTAAAGVGGSGAGVASIVAGSAFTGIGFLVLGTSTKQEDEHITYDCWKPVVHDVSEEPSNGMYLKDLFSHENIQKVTMATDCSTSLPNIVIENIWKEEFQIEYMMLNSTGEIVCHAKQM